LFPLLRIGCDSKGTEGHKYPPGFHTPGKTIVRGILTRGEDLEKRDILGFEPVIAQLLLAHTEETPQLFRSMGFPFHNKVPCGAQSWMIGSQELRIDRQVRCHLINKMLIIASNLPIEHGTRRLAGRQRSLLTF
jgi:hypothetical protein